MGEQRGLLFLDLDEEMPRGAGGLIIAIPAADIGSGAQAWERIDLLIDGADDREQADVFGAALQEMASATPCAAAHQASNPQLDQDQLEETLGDLLVIGDGLRMYGPLPNPPGEMDQRLYRVFGSMREHSCQFL
jgi:hypothetical protein